MLTTLFLSVDSMFAGAMLRFFGTSRRHLRLACLAMGLADAIALSVGRAFHTSIVTLVTPSELRILLAVCGLVSLLLGRAAKDFPRIAIPAIAILFSIDNLLGGAFIPSLASPAAAAGMVLISSALACLAGFVIADAIAGEVSPRVSVAFAAVMAGACFLLF